MAGIEVSAITKRFGKTTAVDGASFTVADGEFFCLLGPSGAGKTTTLKTIAGLTEPDSGSIHIDDVDVRDIEPTHRGLAMCFEGYALYPQRDVFNNLVFPLRSPRLKLPEAQARQRVEHIAAMLGIDHLLDRPVTQLSNGQRQRVALGRVLVRPARAYLLDEPLAHLDAKLRTTMRAELKSISHTDKTTSIYVTHDYVEALSLADRIAVIRDGRILQVGTPTELWEKPADAFVAQAFGKPRINLVPGVIDGSEFIGADGAIRTRLPELTESVSEAQLGIRPRDIEIDPTGSAERGDRFRLSGKVYVLEHLGRHTEVTAEIGPDRVSLVAPRHEVADLRIGDNVGLLINPNSVHVFAAGDEGNRIS